MTTAIMTTATTAPPPTDIANSDSENEAEVDDESDIDNETDGNETDDNDNAADDNEADVESDDGEEAPEEDIKLQGFAGMGDVIGKILDKSLPTATNVVLCKSKKSKKRKLDAKEEQIARKEKESKLAASRELNHVVPTRGSAPKEAALKRVATRGVVKLLNAVSQHQKNVSEKMKEERTEAGKDKVVEKVAKPSNFMELLKKKKPNTTMEEGEKKKKKKKMSTKEESEDEIKEEEEEEEGKKWSVLREDFMMGSSMKDWDKIESGNDDNDDDDDDDDDDGDDGESSSDDEKG